MSPGSDPFDRIVTRCEWDGDCLVWTGKKARLYGVISIQNRKVYVHRWVYENTVGPVPDGFEIDHVASRGCHSKVCVNPDHLEPVTHAVNQERGRLTVCRSGRHDLTLAENQVWDSQGRRRGCRACKREREARRVRVQR